jgi:hypothetical protein
MRPYAHTHTCRWTNTKKNTQKIGRKHRTPSEKEKKRNAKSVPTYGFHLYAQRNHSLRDKQRQPQQTTRARCDPDSSTPFHNKILLSPNHTPPRPHTTHPAEGGPEGRLITRITRCAIRVLCDELNSWDIVLRVDHNIYNNDQNT